MMAIGQGISDEDVFATVKKNLEDMRELWDDVVLLLFFYLTFLKKRFYNYLCCVGKKPSNAEFYLDNVSDVETFMNRITSLYRKFKKDSL